MRFNISQEGVKLICEIEGELDVRTSPDLERELIPALENKTEAVIDLKGVTYLSSAGLRVLLQAAKIMDQQGKLTVKNVDEEVMLILQVTGFDSLLNIE